MNSDAQGRQGDVEVIVVSRAAGGWHVSCVYYKEPGCPPVCHPMSKEPWAPETGAAWQYLKARCDEGQGGNGYTYEVAGLAVPSVQDIEPAVTGMAAEMVAATHGPLGEVSGTLLLDEVENGAAVALPFVVLSDDRGNRFLVEAPAPYKPHDVSVTFNAETVPATTFQSEQHWQRNGAAAWLLIPQRPYEVIWDGGRRTILLTDDGSIVSETDSGSGRNDVSSQVPPIPPFTLTRVELPSWVTQPESAQARACGEATGDQPEWSCGLPGVYRALSNPHGGEPILRKPAGNDLWSSTAYWGPILHLLLYGQGWTRPDRGLKSWYDAGRPPDGPVLSLIDAVWGQDGTLDSFAAWASKTAAQLNEGRQLRRLVDMREDAAAVPRHAAWLRAEQQDRESASQGPSPVNSGGHDPLHLSGHCFAPLARPSPSAHFIRDDRSRRAVIFLNSLSGWYRSLHQLGRSLARSLPSSRVTVIVRPIGTLGEFRRSTETGLWFQGRHRWHVAGN